MDKYFEGIGNTLREAGINKGDLVYVASDIRYFLYSLSCKIGIKDADGQKHLILNSLLDVVTTPNIYCA